MSNNQTEAQRWLDQAQHDIRAAAHSREGDFHEIACFLAQQAAEKALKAYLYARGERPVLGHATHLLVQRCAAYEPGFLDLLDGCRRLDQYYIATRYPNGIPDGIPHDLYTAAQSAEAVTFTHALIGAITRTL